MHWFVLHEAFASKVVIEVKYNLADVMSKNMLSGEWFALMKPLIFWTWHDCDDSVKMRGVSLGHLLILIMVLKDRKSIDPINAGQKSMSAANAGENKNDKKGKIQDLDTRLST